MLWLANALNGKDGEHPIAKAFWFIVAPILVSLTLGFLSYQSTIRERIDQTKTAVVDNCHDINALRESLREIILISARDGDRGTQRFIDEALPRLESQSCRDLLP